MKINMSIWAVSDSESEKGFRLELIPARFEFFMSDSEVKISEGEAFFDSPPDMTEQDMALKAISTMEEKQKRIIADAQMKAIKLQEKINNLKRLTFVPS